VITGDIPRVFPFSHFLGSLVTGNGLMWLWQIPFLDASFLVFHTSLLETACVFTLQPYTVATKVTFF